MTAKLRSIPFMSVIASVTALLVAGCGGGDDPPTATALLAGTAATGAPITGGKVDVACASGAPVSTTTSSTGAFEVALQGQTLPCKLKVSGGSLTNGEAYHSVALQAGTVNLTPLTDLVVARMHGGAPTAWFTAISAADFLKLTADAVNTALGAVTSGLGLATTLGGKNPMTAAFEAKTSDSLDKVLEALKAASPNHGTLLTAAQGTNWNTLAQTYVAAINAALSGVSAGGGATDPSAGGGSGTTPTVSPGAGALACTDTEMMTLSKGAVRSATAEELAGYFRDYVGTFDHAGNNNYVAATATFSSKGEVTVKWTGGEKTYTGTSFCYDTTIGAADYGNTLYVKFSNGKVDLWKKNGNFAGWVKAPA